jgi:hypothetical protein
MKDFSDILYEMAIYFSQPGYLTFRLENFNVRAVCPMLTIYPI